MRLAALVTGMDGQDELRVPRSLVDEIVEALHLGAEAVLDRDWDCYTDTELADAEAYVDRRFGRLIRTLGSVAITTPE